MLRYTLPTLIVLGCATSTPVDAAGLLVPDDPKLPPLAMVNHKVIVTIEDQVCITTVEQTFRNHTDQNLEATYLFSVPKGAGVDSFIMWVDGKKIEGELLDAKKAAQIYTDIVRRTQDPGLLEYLGNSAMRLRVFPIPPKGDQRVKISYKFVAPKDHDVVEYIYPLKTDGKATRTLEEFSVSINIKSQHSVQNVYSPTHAITTKRISEKEVDITFERNQMLLDKDFQLFYGSGNKDIGLTPLLYRPITAEDGYFMFLVSPQIAAEKKRVPRDIVLVLDTSSSMSEIKMQQAKKALKYCLAQLHPEDRFNVIRFSTSVTPFREQLCEANKDYIDAATKWIDTMKPSGGTAIWPALDEALGMRSKDPNRPFTIIFFTDGQPTVDETNPDAIVKKVMEKNTGNTRIFTFGVGDDVNAAMLDQLADSTRAVSTYVREAEDIETKVTSLYGKISNPVLTDLKMATTGNVQIDEMYPPRLPDLFQGQQLVIIGRYRGDGHSAVKLSGFVGKEKTEFIYELNFPAKTEGAQAKDFVEYLWARRKVGYLLDQIRVNGEKDELIKEVVALAKKYGIATPYTSYLVVPDGPVPVVPPTPRPEPRPRPVPFPAPPIAGGIGLPPGIAPAVPGTRPMRVEDFAKIQADAKTGGLATNRGHVTDQQVKEALEKLKVEKDPRVRAQLTEELKRFAEQKKVWEDANSAFKGRKDSYQTGQLGVDLACASTNLRNQDRLSLTANRQVHGRNCIEVGGVWIDDGYKTDTKSVTVKAQSDAYFRILELYPQMKDVFRLGNYVVWITPSGVALVIDPNDGTEKMTDADIAALFEK